MRYFCEVSFYFSVGYASVTPKIKSNGIPALQFDLGLRHVHRLIQVVQTCYLLSVNIQKANSWHCNIQLKVNVGAIYNGNVEIFIEVMEISPWLPCIFYFLKNIDKHFWSAKLEPKFKTAAGRSQPLLSVARSTAWCCGDNLLSYTERWGRGCVSSAGQSRCWGAHPGSRGEQPVRGEALVGLVLTPLRASASVLGRRGNTTKFLTVKPWKCFNKRKF